MGKLITVDVEVLGVLKVGDRWFILGESEPREVSSEEVEPVLAALLGSVP